MTDLIELRGAEAEVWFDENRRPERLYAGHHRWIVIDEPSPLGYVEPSHALTHPPAGRIASSWRLTARTYDTGEVRVLDVEKAGDHWTVAASYV